MNNLTSASVTKEYVVDTDNTEAFETYPLSMMFEDENIESDVSAYD